MPVGFYKELHGRMCGCNLQRRQRARNGLVFTTWTEHQKRHLLQLGVPWSHPERMHQGLTKRVDVSPPEPVRGLAHVMTALDRPSRGADYSPCDDTSIRWPPDREQADVATLPLLYTWALYEYSERS